VAWSTKNPDVSGAGRLIVSQILVRAKNQNLKC